jgi:hypothetical protein
VTRPAGAAGVSAAFAHGGTFGAFAFAFARAATARSRAGQRQRSRRSIGYAHRAGGAFCQRPRGRCVAGDVYGRLANDHGQTILRTRTSLSVFDVELQHRKQAPFAASAKTSSSPQPTSGLKVTPRDRSEFKAAFGSYNLGRGGAPPRPSTKH